MSTSYSSNYIFTDICSYQIFRILDCTNLQFLNSYICWSCTLLWEYGSKTS